MKHLFLVVILIGFGVAEKSASSDCGKRKVCFFLPSDAKSFVGVGYIGDGTFEYTISGETEGYLAMGLSRDEQMGSDGVFGCIFNKDTNSILVTPSKNVGYSNEPLEGEDGKFIDIELVKTERNGNENLCVFRTGNPKLKFGEFEFDLEREGFHLLIAKGPSSGEIISKHSEAIGTESPLNFTLYRMNSPNSGNDTGPFSSQIQIKGKAKNKIWLKLHASFMIFAWNLLIPVGMMISRFYKETWVDITICGRRFWFLLHTSFMLTALTLAILGTIFIQVNRGYFFLPDPNSASFAHCLMGIFALLFVIVNCTGFWIHPKTKLWRNLAFICHFILGLTSFYLGIVNIALTPTWMGNQSIYPCFLPYLILCWWALHIIFFLTWSGLISFYDRTNSKGWIDYDGWRMFSVPMKIIYTDQEAPRPTLRKFLLLAYFGMDLGVSLFIVTSVKDQHPC